MKISLSKILVSKIAVSEILVSEIVLREIVLRGISLSEFTLSGIALSKIVLAGSIHVGLGRATFFMVRVRFRACSFCTGRDRVTVNLDGLISGQNISNSGHFRAAFGPHLSHYYI